MADIEEMQRCLLEMREGQYQKLLSYGRQVIPSLTSEDLLQPCDYPELEQHPVFRYEEGVLAGIEMALVALRALLARKIS